MGIQNLLRELKPITQNNAHLSEFRGQTCGVDASCWLILYISDIKHEHESICNRLHRAAHSCAIDLVRGIATNKYLKFTFKCIDILKHFDITPIIVFDGAALPMKANENEKRRKMRQEAQIEAIRCHNNKQWEDAYKYASRAVRITNEMVSAFINQCRQSNVQFICAPYEADAQLGYMYKNGQIDFVITEDSDLFLFGVRKSLLKFDANKCCGNFVNLDKIRTCNKGDLCLFLKKFENNLREFIHVCVLSGCDYVSSLYGIGIKKAIKYVTENRKIDRLLFILMRQKGKKAPKDYKIQFKRAVLTFLHQTVYDIKMEKMIYLNPLTDDVDSYLNDLNKHLSKLPEIQQYDSTDYRPTVYDKSLNFLGKHADKMTAKLIAKGQIDAKSLKKRNLCSTLIQTQKVKEKVNIFQIRSQREKCATKKKAKIVTQKEKYFEKLDDGLSAIDDVSQLILDYDWLEGEVRENSLPNTQSNSSRSTVSEGKEFSDEQDENSVHEPLKRKRKRKRSRIEMCETESTPFKEKKNMSNRILRRKLNDGSAFMNHSKFVPMTPQNRLCEVDKSGMCVSLISDLLSCSKNNVEERRRNFEKFDDDIYEIADDEVSDEKERKYSQNSQSQSEKQMEDIRKYSQKRKEREHEDDEECAKVTIKTKRKKFNPPRCKNNLPQKKKSKKKTKVSKKKQMKISSMWRKSR